MKFKVLAIATLALLLAATAIGTAAGAQDRERVLQASAHYCRLDSGSQALPGADGTIVLVLVLTPAPGWHAAAPNPADALSRPPHLEMTHEGTTLTNYLPPGIPKPDPFTPGTTIPAYGEPTPLFVPLPASALGLELPATLTAVMCAEDRCVLPRQELLLALPGDAASLPALGDSPWGEAFGAALALGPVRQPGQAAPAPEVQFSPRPFAPGLEVASLIPAILLGLVAGLLLNVMPCVLPVVSLKLSGLLAGIGPGNERERIRRLREHNLFFALGILLWFAFLALLLGASGLAWGQVFQSAWVVGGLAVLLVVLATSLLGLFHLPVVDLRFDQAVSHPRLKALATGLLATLLATPCSGPFLGGVLGWVLLRSPAEIMIVFLAVGVGMASPYFAFMAWPGLALRLPRPGPWLVQVERGVALFLLASAIYLVSILPDLGLVPWLMSAWCLGAAWWLWGLVRTVPAMHLLRLMALVLALAGPATILSREAPVPSANDYSPEQFAQLLGQTPLVLYFTADWCPTCKVLEATVLTPATIKRLSERHQAVFLRVDLTRANPAGEALLKSLGSHSIPLVAVFPSGQGAAEPVIIRDLFTPAQLEAALAQAASRQP